MPEPPRVDSPFSWADYRGFSAFALVGYEPEHVRAVYAQAMASGWNTARVCAETEFWDNTGFLKQVPRDLVAVDRLLDTVARIKGAQVLLIGDCTIKSGNPAQTDPVGEAWNQQVVDLLQQKQYQNVALEVVNEGWHPFYKASRQSVLRRIDYARSRGVQAGSDDHICLGEANVPHYLLGRADFYTFHPCRTDARDNPWDPPASFLEKVGTVNGHAYLSETVAYSEIEAGGLRTQDRGRIERYIETCASVPGCRFTYHSDFGLEAGYYPWFPQAR